jgi:thiol-disulfide isomerase/thioredoxin
MAMKYHSIILLALAIVFSSCSAKKSFTGKAETEGVADQAKPFDYHQQASWLLGYFNLNMLKQEPHSSWFYKGYDEYTPIPEEINKLKEIGFGDLSIKIVMGTWCPDSRRETPRFMKIMDLWGFPNEKITFIGVDMDKKAPVGDFENLDIQRVPTFIILKNNIEAGRIIEVPKTSLEQDLVNILR